MSLAVTPTLATTIAVDWYGGNTIELAFGDTIHELDQQTAEDILRNVEGGADTVTIDGHDHHLTEEDAVDLLTHLAGELSRWERAIEDQSAARYPIAASW